MRSRHESNNKWWHVTDQTWPLGNLPMRSMQQQVVDCMCTCADVCPLTEKGITWPLTCQGITWPLPNLYTHCCLCMTPANHMYLLHTYNCLWMVLDPVQLVKNSNTSKCAGVWDQVWWLSTTVGACLAVSTQPAHVRLVLEGFYTLSNHRSISSMY